VVLTTAARAAAAGASVLTMIRRVVIGYDGSAEARRAILFAGRALATECALVVHVWHDSGVVVASLAAPPAMVRPHTVDELDRAATAVAEQGANLAQAAGFAASVAIRRAAAAGDTARVLLDVAVEYEADLIVVARTHASRLDHLLRGSVSASAVRAGRLPVLVVPG
jgi:nucleotide-binding universal stress UspA family protein